MTTRTAPRWWPAAALAAALALATTLPGCTATPLPTPPSARAELMSIDEGQPMRLAFTGRPGAIAAGPTTLRITTTRIAVITSVDADGSFSAMLPGSRSDVFWLELLRPDRDEFAGAFTGVPTTTEVTSADAGPDGDGDDSPDAVDCAPADPTQHGRRCPATCSLPELCGDGADSDCDGVIDEGCGVTCASDADCPVLESCCDGACVDPVTDPLHCGTCGNACMAVACIDGACGGCSPAAREICSNRVDDDCDGAIDELDDCI